uniref:Uncharacterized protein n=1 Tax=Vespula pensylvanica TaxID=30213 RepID=A0A834U412_VESPE|nr:hypothetical protein H0235_012196 [Vespula pensylvanica]
MDVHEVGLGVGAISNVQKIPPEKEINKREKKNEQKRRRRESDRTEIFDDDNRLAGTLEPRPQFDRKSHRMEIGTHTTEEYVMTEKDHRDEESFRFSGIQRYKEKTMGSTTSIKARRCEEWFFSDNLVVVVEVTADVHRGNTAS